MEPVKVRNLKIGEGIPKICVPLVGVSKDEILEAAKEIKEIPMDFVEWRADWFCDILEWEKALEVLKGLRKKTREKIAAEPLFFWLKSRYFCHFLQENETVFRKFTTSPDLRPALPPPPGRAPPPGPEPAAPEGP